jgi:hypothetical protein
MWYSRNEHKERSTDNNSSNVAEESASGCDCQLVDPNRGIQSVTHVYDAIINYVTCRLMSQSKCGMIDESRSVMNLLSHVYELSLKAYHYIILEIDNQEVQGSRARFINSGLIFTHFEWSCQKSIGIPLVFGSLQTIIPPLTLILDL